MHLENNKLTLSTGRVLNAHAGVIGFGRRDIIGVYVPGIYGGFDDVIHEPGFQELTQAEQIEIADYMLAEWQKFRDRIGFAPVEVGTVVTGEQVKQAMTVKGLHSVDCRPCSICDEMTRYVRHENFLFFNGSCGCSSVLGLAPRTWQSAADWINSHPDPESKRDVMQRFGFDLG